MGRRSDPELRPNELSLMGGTADRDEGRRAWPLPVSLYRLVFVAILPVATLAWSFALSWPTLAAVALGFALVGQLLSRSDRWRPPGDT